MKKVLILGGSHRDIPLIQAAQNLGFFVITLANRDDYLGHSYANKFYKIDFNDLDKIRLIIKNKEIGHLIPGCGEASYINTVKLARELNVGNFDDLEIAKLVHNKWRFKEFCLQNDISTPKGLLCNQDKGTINLHYPVMVKPTTLSGGNGVNIVYDKNELRKSIEKSKTLSDEIFLEEYIKGELIAYSVFFKDRKILYSFSGKDDVYLNKYLVTTAYPIKLKPNTEQKIREDIEKVAHLLKLVDGMFHLQIIIKDEVPYIIDVTRRIPGDLYPKLIEYCDEVEYSKAVVKAYLGDKITNEFASNKAKQNFVIRHVVMPNKNGKFKKLFIDDTIKEDIIYQLNMLHENNIIDNYLHTQVGILFIKLNVHGSGIIHHLNSLIYPIIKKTHV